MGVIVVVSALAWLLPEPVLLDRLAKVNEAILAGEVWRLVTVALVHAGVLHLFFNVAILLDVGRSLERLVGGPRMIATLVLGTAAGSLVSVAFVSSPGVGASGGVFAVAGALVAFGLRHRAILPAATRQRLVRATGELIGLNLVLTFAVPRIDWAAHVGGLVAGALLGLAYGPSSATRAALARPAWGAGESPPE